MTVYTFNIKSAADFNTDVALIDAGGKDARGSNNIYDFNITASYTLDRQLDAINLTSGTASGDVLNISGSSSPDAVATLDGNNRYNGLFVYNGTVNVSDLTIANAVAQGGAGGGGASASHFRGGGGGGGAGLGGGLFVAGPNPTAYGATTMTTGGNVTLTYVGFTGDSAIGGAGATFSRSDTSYVGGGGGGLGGDGGDGGGVTAGGGGGVGLGASGGAGNRNGGGGVILGAQGGGPSYKYGAGGANGGGGGSGSPFQAGGGGVVGTDEVTRSGNTYYLGIPSGGFGGGGGGGSLSGGNGGFGGGGGGAAGEYAYGGDGGFGGGGGGGDAHRDVPAAGYPIHGGDGGFGGGYSAPGAYAGGGGLGAGGDIFVQQGGTLTIGGASSLAAGMVTGGTGAKDAFGFNVPGGAALGNGLFLQGNQTVTLGGPGSDGDTITVAGVIADEPGSVVPRGDGTGMGAGSLIIDEAVVTLSGANTYSGGTTIEDGDLDFDQADIVSDGHVISGAAGTGSITFAGTAYNFANLTLEKTAQPASGGTFATSLTHFGNYTSLFLNGVTYTAGSTAVYDSSTHLLTVKSDGITENFTLNDPGATKFYTHAEGLNDTVTVVNTVCFVSGTRIRVARDGAIVDVAVERLVVGDLAVTASGAHRPIRWIGHRTIDCRRQPHPDAARPVRIAAHAIEAGAPARDLFVSPGHAICLNVIAKVLIPAFSLLNGTTIHKVATDLVTYWHVELETHDILLAENLPAESYLESGNRDFFQGVDLVSLMANPDPRIYPETRIPAGFCYPFHATGPVVEIVRSRLRARAIDAGWRLDANDCFAALHLIVDGARIDPVRRYLVARFIVPPDARDVWLVSVASRPCEVADSPDDRALGVCVRSLTIADGFAPPFPIDLADPMLCKGFYDLEHGDRRWTTDRAYLPAELWKRLDGAASNGFFLRVELACPAVPRWIAPVDAQSLVPPVPRLALIANST